MNTAVPWIMCRLWHRSHKDELDTRPCTRHDIEYNLAETREGLHQQQWGRQPEGGQRLPERDALKVHEGQSILWPAEVEDTKRIMLYIKSNIIRAIL